MVKEIEREGKLLYVCEECKSAYEEKIWAEEYCSEHHACSMEIIMHAVQILSDENIK